jgi:hypothetical protein
MTNEQAQWQSTVSMILPDLAETSVLVAAGEIGWSLPQFQHAGRAEVNTIGPVVDFMRAQYGVEVGVLRCLSIQLDRSACRAALIFLLESRDASQQPSQGRWIDRESLAMLKFAAEDQRLAIEHYFEQRTDGSDQRLAPWAKAGWFAQAEGWIEGQLRRMGFSLLAPIQQKKNWTLSCVLQANTSAGDVYFKAPARWDLAADEPVLIQALSTLYPTYIPAPIAIDAKRRWMLLGDIGEPLGSNPDTALWVQTVQALARMQTESAKQIGVMWRIGCVDRRLQRLAIQIDPFANDSAVAEDLGAEQLEKFKALVPRLKEMCRDLARYRVPEALGHGDFHSANIAVKSGKVLFFDWTDGCVGHPFFDLATLLHSSDHIGAEDWNRLRDTYLAYWTEYEPLERLQEAWTLAEPLGALHQMISYQSIFAKLEGAAKLELKGAIGYWLEKLLKMLQG